MAASTAWIVGLSGAAVGALWWLTKYENPIASSQQPSIVVKGSHVRFEMANGRLIALPNHFGIVHDVDGKQLSRCAIFFVPFRRTNQSARMSAKARAYLGSKYDAKLTAIDVPKGSWNSIGDVAQIFYKRRGSIQPVKFYHPFKRVAPRLFKSGEAYKLQLPDGCVVNDRGFVYP